MTKIEITFENLSSHGTHLLIGAWIDNVLVRLLLDTGASNTVFDMASIKKKCKNVVIVEQEIKGSGLGGNHFETALAIIDKLEIGGIRINNFRGVVMNLQHINHIYESQNKEGIDGILGNDILCGLNAEIRYFEKTLTLYEL